MAFKTFTVGEVFTASDANTMLMKQVLIVCTSGTRPSSPSEGWHIYETDTNLWHIYDGAAWIPMGSPSAWASYSPAWTSTGTAPSLGNGTLTGAQLQLGKLMCIRVVLTIGSTTTNGTGSYRFSIPAGGKVNSLLSAFAFDTSAVARSAGTAQLITNAATGDNMRILFGTTVCNETTPFTWATGDTITLAGSYELD